MLIKADLHLTNEAVTKCKRIALEMKPKRTKQKRKKKKNNQTKNKKQTPQIKS